MCGRGGARGSAAKCVAQDAWQSVAFFSMEETSAKRRKITLLDEMTQSKLDKWKEHGWTLINQTCDQGKHVYEFAEPGNSSNKTSNNLKDAQNAVIEANTIVKEFEGVATPSANLVTSTALAIPIVPAIIMSTSTVTSVPDFVSAGECLQNKMLFLDDAKENGQVKSREHGCMSAILSHALKSLKSDDEPFDAVLRHVQSMETFHVGRSLILYHKPKITQSDLPRDTSEMQRMFVRHILSYS